VEVDLVLDVVLGMLGDCVCSRLGGGWNLFWKRSRLPHDPETLPCWDVFWPRDHEAPCEDARGDGFA
jgi:hypothetical protein